MLLPKDVLQLDNFHSSVWFIWIKSQEPSPPQTNCLIYSLHRVVLTNLTDGYNYLNVSECNVVIAKDCLDCQMGSYALQLCFPIWIFDRIFSVIYACI